MVKMRITLVTALAFMMLTVANTYAETYTLSELAGYAKAIVPDGYQKTNADEEDGTAFMAFQKHSQLLSPSPP